MWRLLAGLFLVGLWQLVPPTNLRLVQGIPSSSGTVVTITSPTSSATYDAGSSATVPLSGTAQANQTISACTWTNSLGGSGSATGTGTWSIASVALTVGSNVITVTCPNAIGTGTDVITVTRSGSSSDSCAGAATCWYVRPDGGAYGSENGTDWSNAFDGFTDVAWASMACGDVLLVAGGTYTQNLVLNKTCSSEGTRLIVRRARADDTGATGAAGWSSGFDSQVLMDDSEITMGNVAYITVSGKATGDTCGVTVNATCGWLIQSSVDGVGIEAPNGTSPDFVTIEYMEIEGPSPRDYTTIGRGVDITPINATPTNLIFSHLQIHHWESAFYLVPCQTCTVEYSEIYDIDDTDPTGSCCHPNMAYIDASNGATSMENFTWRNNIQHGDIGEGVFYTNSSQSISGLFFYGNVFYSIVDSKCLQLDNGGTTDNVKVFNNTFDGGCPQGTVVGNGGYTNTETRNNIYSRMTAETLGTASNNLTTTDASVFVNRAANDYHITSTISGGFPRNAGTNVGAIYTPDRDSVTRGGDGTWDIGAYEYTAGAPAPAPDLWVRLVRWAR